ncbi:ABC-type dipeptide/oligopeptide/nickel transport system permease subunit [Streptosporangium becharense]|uniref:ABC-type dipeptide/oligopeptide/nickel transport system permease subunit n=1 Tax=Streptosporangium becharense TaxID=1816182 RepID=A0A7W9IBV6_9ACTN|nr:ABC transporter permease [Streptosporangium becharense]MBB2913771.1 ABC-type dipeptide/oligopeptide/nickel transport system permease subunit [Streptosporangium becharense]MBB5817852.1 ABC-type dipeptide/oligopeptide/nickel transport system permease subunit [Streptosporangium becharense]
MTAPLDVSGTAMEAQPEAVIEGVGAKAIEGRSLGQIAWMRLKRDKVAIGGAIVVFLLILIAVLAPLIVGLFGHPIDKWNNDLVDPGTGAPLGSFGGISSEHLLGVEPTTGRDIFSRIVYGAQVSLLIGVLSALVAVLIGTIMGGMAGFFGGWLDQMISRLMDLLLAFPQLLFAIALVSVVPDKLWGLEGSGVRMGVLIVVIGLFGWPYIGRIVRGQVITLREREFVDAARSLGATRMHILRSEILPNLVAPILVYTTLIIPTNILTEASLSFLGVGVKAPTPSWGQMLSDAISTYQTAPLFMIIPGTAIFVTVLAFNLFGDGLRDALDPRVR